MLAGGLIVSYKPLDPSARGKTPHVAPEVETALQEMQWDTRVLDARARRAAAKAKSEAKAAEDKAKAKVSAAGAAGGLAAKSRTARKELGRVDMGKFDTVQKDLRDAFRETSGDQDRGSGRGAVFVGLSIAAVAAIVPFTLNGGIGGSIGSFIGDGGWRSGFGPGGPEGPGDGPETVVPTATVDSVDGFDGSETARGEIPKIPIPADDTTENAADQGPAETATIADEAAEKGVLASELEKISRPVGELPSLEFGRLLDAGPVVASLPTLKNAPETDTEVGLFALPSTSTPVEPKRPVTSGEIIADARAGVGFTPEASPEAPPARSPQVAAVVPERATPEGSLLGDDISVPAALGAPELTPGEAIALAGQAAPRGFEAEAAPENPELAQPNVAADAPEAAPQLALAGEAGAVPDVPGAPQLSRGASGALAAQSTPQGFEAEDAPRVPELAQPVVEADAPEAASQLALVGDSVLAPEAFAEPRFAPGTATALAAQTTPRGFEAEDAPEGLDLSQPVVVAEAPATRLPEADVLLDLAVSEPVAVLGELTRPGALADAGAPGLTITPEPGPAAPDLDRPNVATEIAGLAGTLDSGDDPSLPDDVTGALAATAVPGALADAAPLDAGVSPEASPALPVGEAPELVASAPSIGTTETDPDPAEEELALVLPSAQETLELQPEVGLSGLTDGASQPEAFTPEAEPEAVDLVEPEVAEVAPAQTDTGIADDVVSALAVPPRILGEGLTRLTRPREMASAEQEVAEVFAPRPGPDQPVLEQPEATTELEPNATLSPELAEALGVSAPRPEAEAPAEQIVLVAPIVRPAPPTDTALEARVFGPEVPRVAPIPRDDAAAPAVVAPDDVTGAIVPVATDPTTSEADTDFGQLTLSVYAPTNINPSVSVEAESVLRLGGVENLRMASVNFTIRTNQVRYYHAEDQAKAEQIASMTGAELRDFTDFSPSPPLGALELWLEGQSMMAPRVARAKVKAVTPRPVAVTPAVSPTVTPAASTLVTASVNTAIRTSRRTEDDRRDSPSSGSDNGGGSSGGNSGGGGGASGGSGGGNSGGGRGERDFGG